MKNIPRKIYLNLGLRKDESKGLDFNKLEGVTWGTERIDNEDIEYSLNENNIALPSVEDVKRWYELLVGKGEDAMRNDMKIWFNWESLRGKGLDKPIDVKEENPCNYFEKETITTQIDICKRCGQSIWKHKF